MDRCAKQNNNRPAKKQTKQKRKGGGEGKKKKKKKKKEEEIMNTKNKMLLCVLYVSSVQYCFDPSCACPRLIASFSVRCDCGLFCVQGSVVITVKKI